MLRRGYRIDGIAQPDEPRVVFDSYTQRLPANGGIPFERALAVLLVAFFGGFYVLGTDGPLLPVTREKIVAAASRTFVCIADASKLVDVLGKFPLPVEVIPMARSLVARELVKLGGEPALREGFTTDNGNVILDVKGLEIMEPCKLETEINNIPGVVTVGIFANRPADVLLLGTASGVQLEHIYTEVPEVAGIQRPDSLFQAGAHLILFVLRDAGPVQTQHLVPELDLGLEQVAFG